jgi:CRISPR-associated exonuclease Cas4
MTELSDGEGTLITASVFLSYVNCKRQAWLTLHRFSPESENTNILIGNFIHQSTFRREKHKEIELPGAKIDMIWKNAKMTVVGEIKKSSKSSKGARIQLLYYLKLLKDRDIEATGEIIIPDEHKRIKITLGENELKEIQSIEDEITILGQMNTPPKPKKTGLCRKCGHVNYCWA